MTLDEINDVVAAQNLYTSNQCGYLNGWFSIGWGEKTRMWDNLVLRYNDPLNGDRHGGQIHIWSGTDDFERTLAHELLHWYNDEYDKGWSHETIRDKAEECSSEVQS